MSKKPKTAAEEYENVEDGVYDEENDRHIARLLKSEKSVGKKEQVEEMVDKAVKRKERRDRYK